MVSHPGTNGGFEGQDVRRIFGAAMLVVISPDPRSRLTMEIREMTHLCVTSYKRTVACDEISFPAT